MRLEPYSSAIVPSSVQTQNLGADQQPKQPADHECKQRRALALRLGHLVAYIHPQMSPTRSEVGDTGASQGPYNGCRDGMRTRTTSGGPDTCSTGSSIA